MPKVIRIREIDIRNGPPRSLLNDFSKSRGTHRPANRNEGVNMSQYLADDYSFIRKRMMEIRAGETKQLIEARHYGNCEYFMAGAHGLCSKDACPRSKPGRWANTDCGLLW